MNARSARQGFTLVELLVVITILGILAALLFPVFLNVRERAHMTTCASNLHQLGLALQMYEQDWNGFQPISGPYYYNPPGPPHCLQLFTPYDSSMETYRCPDDTRSIPDGACGSSYSYRDDLALPDEPQDAYGHFGSGFLIAPAPETVLMYCQNHVQSDPKTGNSAISGSYLALRQDGAVSVVPAAKVAWWSYQKGKWLKLDSGAVEVGVLLTYGSPTVVFPDEPWPLQYRPGGLRLR